MISQPKDKIEKQMAEKLLKLLESEKTIYFPNLLVLIIFIISSENIRWPL